MNIKDYWTQPPRTQDKMITASQPKPSYLRPKGCKCHMPDARACWAQKHGEIAASHPHITCACACHTDLGGDA